MADSTTHLDQISASQAQKEVSANAIDDAMSPAATFGRRATTTAALVWGYFGGRMNGTSVANGTVTVTASTTNYVVAHRSTLAVTTSTSNTNWNNTSTYGRMYLIITGSATVTSYEDHRFGTGGILTPVALSSPGGSDTYIQYNDAGALGGDSRLTFNETSKVTTGQFAIDSNGVNAQTGTTYTLVAADNGKVVTLSNASAITVTVPSGLGAGFSCICIQIDAGQVTFAVSSTTINPSGTLKIAAQHGAASLIAYASNVFNLSGNIAA